MRARVPAATVAAAAVLLLAAGCGSASGARVGPSDPEGVAAQPDCGDVVLAPGGGATAREVCLGVGSTLRLRLGPGEHAPTEKGDALTEVSPGVYRGARAGTAELSGFRRSCPDARPGVGSCHALAGWKVTVDVR